MEEKKKFSFSVKNNSDLIVAFVVILIVMMIIIPLPTWMLDILLAFNIALALVILLITMFTTNVLQFSVFPSILLITTLFRLALNISSTRLILSTGDAGEIIKAFGDFVVGDSYVVGIIIFLIIVIIQFMVITNGAGRVSEVTARFTLDAMPGKQMSIDADLNSGLIDEAGAKKRREELQMEADFYGSMDGASKFVKGDAVAGLIITAINIIAGIVIGMTMQGLSVGEAAELFTKLTVGDGLVSQVPALLISTASGILVTRSDNKSNFGDTIVKQMTTFPKVIAIASFVLLVFAIIPGLPTLVFLAMSAITGYIAYILYKEEENEKQREIEEKEMEIIETEQKEPENVMNLVKVEPMEIEIGYGLIPLADETTGGDLLQRIASVRRQCAIEMGVIVQPIRIRDNLQLKNNEYVVKIRGTVIEKGELMPGMFLCMDPTSNEINLPGIKTVEPTFGLPALWINKDSREEAEIQGLTVVDPTTVMVTHLTETIKAHSYELLGRQEVKELIDSLKDQYSAVIDELIPDLMTIGEIQKVLRNLLMEKVPIKDMVTILETLADQSRTSKDIELLTEYVRISLGRTITMPLLDENNVLVVVTLDGEIEEIIGNNLQKSIQGTFPALDPQTTQSVLNGIRNTVERVYFNNNIPVILVSPKIRPAFRRLVEMVFPNLMVLSLNEIPNNVEIRTGGVVELA